MPLRAVALGRAADAEGEAPAVRAARGVHRIEVNELGTNDAPVAPDQRFVLEVLARDTRVPEANEGKSAPVRARVVAPEELLRRIQERLARSRMDALRLSEVQRDKRDRVLELLAAFEEDGQRGSAEDVAVAAALAGQRRALGNAQSLASELASVAEDVLYARLDEKANALLLSYDERMTRVEEPGFQSEPWRELARSVEGERSSAGFARSLIGLVGLSVEIAEDHAQGAVTALDQAERALERGEIQAALMRAEESQGRALARIEDLLEKLAEWDNFQNVLSLVRDILGRQKTVQERTQRIAAEK